MKKFLLFSGTLIVALSVMMSGFAEEDNSIIIKGKVEKIAGDGSYIVVNGEKINTTQDFLDDAYIEAEDKLELACRKGKQGLEIVDYDYIFGDDIECGEESEASSDEGSFMYDE
jgi:hypothetical protein